MIVISWNCRGVVSGDTRRHARELLKLPGVGAVCFLETKSSKTVRLLKMAYSLGFTSSFMVDPMGFAGGLLLIWNKERLPLTIVGSNSQAIHTMVPDCFGVPTRFSFSYVRLNRRAKEILWSSCKDYACSFQDPWVMIGDFNDITGPTDQWGNGEVIPSAVDKFLESMNDCGLMDLSTAGMRFSWFRKIGDRVQLRRKLDKAWNSQVGSTIGSIEEVTRLSKDWNHNNFGNIFYKKRKLQARIAGFQSASTFGMDMRLLELETKLTTKLNDVLKQEEGDERQICEKRGFFDLAPPNGSWSWKSIIRGRNTIVTNTCWKVGDGQSINMWKDWWVGSKPLIFDQSIDTSEELMSSKVSDFILLNHTWDIPKLQEILPVLVVDSIRAIPISLNDHIQDSISWPKGDSGSYDNTVGHGYGNSIVGRKIKVFIWIALKGKLLTNSERNKRSNYTRRYIGSNIHNWSATFLFTLWGRWKARNNCVFNKLDTNPLDTVRWVRHQVNDLSSATPHGSVAPTSAVWVQWQRPESGWVKLNTDGAAKKSSGMASAGGLVRDSDGNWLWGFMVNIDITNSFMVELWGLREGLRLCLERGIRWVKVKMNSKAIVDLMNKDGGVEEDLCTLLEDCMDMVSKFDGIIFAHIFREGNKCADRLANLAQGNNWGTSVLDDPLGDLAALLDQDAGDASSCRIR
nr:LINE-type retrotransposon LIb DNA [Ipomoea batatas]